MAFVADEEDAKKALRRFRARRGEVWLPAEIELVGQFKEQAIRAVVANFKRQLDGCLSSNTTPEAGDIIFPSLVQKIICFQVQLVFAGKVVHLATDTEYHKPEPAESPGGETTWIDDLSRF